MEDVRYKRYTLKSGKSLSSAEFGDLNSNRVVFYSHGFPGSYIESFPLKDAALKNGLKVIAFDRPGIGESDFNPAHSILSWGDVFLELLDQIKPEKIFLAGVSGGGPYALSAARAAGNSISKIAVISSMVPVQNAALLEGMIPQNRWLLTQGAKRPFFVKPAVTLLAKGWRASPETALRYLKMILPPADRQILAEKEFFNMLEENLKRSFFQGTRGPLHEFWLMTKPWGFAIEDVKVRADVWHGSADNYVPPAAGQYLASALPNSSFHLIPGAGHFIGFKKIDEILEKFHA